MTGKFYLYGDSLLKATVPDEEFRYHFHAGELLSGHPEVVNRAMMGATVRKGRQLVERDTQRGLNAQYALMGYGGNDSDFDWQIDIKKSKAVPPAYTDDIIRLAAEKATKQSVKVYNSRGTYSDRKGNANAPQLSYVWEQRKDSRGSYSFVLN